MNFFFVFIFAELLRFCFPSNFICPVFEEDPFNQLCFASDDFNNTDVVVIQNNTRTTQSSLQQLSELIAPLKRTLTSLDEFKEQLIGEFRQQQNESSASVLQTTDNSTNSSSTETAAPSPAKSIYNEHSFNFASSTAGISNVLNEWNAFTDNSRR